MLEKTTVGSISLGDIIYSAIKPIVRMYLIIGSGFLLTRKGLLSIETTRALSDLVLICFMPALFFDKIVSNISIDDLETIGVICLSALAMYCFNGIVTTIIIATTPIPKLWRGNALLAGIMQNVSDLPIAYIQSLATGLVFTEEQGEKGVSFVIIWVCMYIFFQFNLGLFQLVEYDYKATEKYELECEDDQEKNISSSDDIDQDDESDDTKESNSKFNPNDNGNSNNNNNNIEKSQSVTKKPSILKVNNQNNKQKNSVNGVNNSTIMNDEATEISKLTINDFDAEGELVRPISHISTLSSAIPADNEEEEEGDSSSLTDESFDSMELAPRLLTEKKPRSNSNNTTHSKVSFKSNHTITSINSNNNKNSNELSRSLSKNSKMSKMSKISTKQQSHIQKPLISFTPIAKIPSARIHNDDYYHLSRNISNTASSVRHRSTGNHQTHSENASISMNQDDPTIDTIDTALDTESSLPPTSLKGLATRHTHTNTNPLVQPLTKIKSNATDKKSIRSFGSIRSITHTVTNAFSGSGSEADETHSYPGNDNYNDDDDDDDDINSLDSRLIAAPTMTEALVREYSRVEPYNRNIPTSIAIATETNLSKKDIEKSGENIPFIKKYKLNWLVFLLKNFLKPNSVVLIVSLAIALIPWTKALFVETKTYIPNAPDGQPPLSFILQYTEYLGQPCVPVGLLLLGSTIARLEINELPKGFWKSVIAHTVYRLCVLPIIGIVIVNRFIKINWIKNPIVVLVNCMEFSLPSPTIQIYLNASNMRPNMKSHLQLDCLALYILAQYATLFISLPFVVSYTIKVVLDY